MNYESKRLTPRIGPQYNPISSTNNKDDKQYNTIYKITNKRSSIPKDEKDQELKEKEKCRIRHLQPPSGVIQFKTQFRNVIYEVMKGRGWKETENDSEWSIIWADKPWVIEEMGKIYLLPFQKLTRKDLLIKHIRKMRKSLIRAGLVEEASHYQFTPLTFTLPDEYAIFVESFKKNINMKWIMKPISKSQGAGIFLFKKLNDIATWRRDYRWNSENPQPLTVWLCRSGFARFSSSRFSMDDDDINNNYVHLTNYSIQKTDPNYEEGFGNKWPISQYGCDIILDVDLNPWLLEFNASPSVTASNLDDHRLKTIILEDTLDIVGIDRDRLPQQQQTHYGSFDLIYQGGHVVMDSNVTNLSFLGSDISIQEGIERVERQRKTILQNMNG